MVSELDEDTVTKTVADGVHELELSPRWSIGGGRLNGGYQLATALRALAGEMTLPDPVVASATFLRPAMPGAARIETEVVRPGRRLGTGSALMLQSGREVLRLDASFTDLAATPAEALDLTSAPDLPAPADCVLIEATGPGNDAITVARRIRVMAPEEPGWRRGEPSGDPTAEFWIAFADASDATLWSLAFVVDAAAPVVFDLGYASSTVALTIHLREHPAPGPLACRTVTRHLAHGLHEEDVDVWDTRGTLVAQSRQMAMLLPPEV